MSPKSYSRIEAGGKIEAKQRKIKLHEPEVEER